MKRGRRSRRAAITIAVIAVVIAIIYGLRMPIAKFALAKGLGAATGTAVSVGGLSMHGGHGQLTNVRISAHHGEQLAYLPRVDVTYNLHDFLPGSTHRYGLRAITVYHPQITVVHNPDGTYNLP